MDHLTFKRRCYNPFSALAGDSVRYFRRITFNERYFRNLFVQAVHITLFWNQQLNEY